MDRTIMILVIYFLNSENNYEGVIFLDVATDIV